VAGIAGNALKKLIHHVGTTLNGLQKAAAIEGEKTGNTLRLIVGYSLDQNVVNNVEIRLATSPTCIDQLDKFHEVLKRAKDSTLFNPATDD
jgi:hypothetical protein